MDTTEQKNKFLDDLRERFHSIAILAVTAQQNLADADKVDDLLYDITMDMEFATRLNDRLR